MIRPEAQYSVITEVLALDAYLPLKGRYISYYVLVYVRKRIKE